MRRYFEALRPADPSIADRLGSGRPLSSFGLLVRNIAGTGGIPITKSASLSSSPSTLPGPLSLAAWTAVPRPCGS